MGIASLHPSYTLLCCSVAGPDALRNGQPFLARQPDRIPGRATDVCEKRKEGLPLSWRNNTGELEPPLSARNMLLIMRDDHLESIADEIRRPARSENDRRNVIHKCGRL